MTWTDYSNVYIHIYHDCDIYIVYNHIYVYVTNAAFALRISRKKKKFLGAITLGGGGSMPDAFAPLQLMGTPPRKEKGRKVEDLTRWQRARNLGNALQLWWPCCSCARREERRILNVTRRKIGITVALVTGGTSAARPLHPTDSSASHGGVTRSDPNSVARSYLAFISTATVVAVPCLCNCFRAQSTVLRFCRPPPSPSWWSLPSTAGIVRFVFQRSE